MKLRIGHLSTLYHTSIVMLAMDYLLNGFAAPLEWKLFGTGPAIVEAFKNDEIDIAYIGLPPAIIGIDKGRKIKCIAGGHIEGTVIASRKNIPGFPDEDDLGAILVQLKTIGVPGRGSIHDLLLRDAIRRYSVDVKVIDLPWADQVLEYFVKGKVDAAVGTPALAQAIIHYADGKIVYPPHLLWPDNPSYGILVNERLLSDNREIIKEFLHLHKTASALLRNESDAVSQEIAEFMGIVDKQFVLNALKISPRYCIALTDGYIQCTMQLMARMRELGYIGRSIHQDNIFDLSIIQEVHPEPDHYRESEG